MNNDKEISLKSLSHLNVVYLLNKQNKSYDDFMKDKVKLDYNHFSFNPKLCTKLSLNFKNNHSYIDFRGIIGLRNVMVHGYGTLHYEDIFTIILDDVPKLINMYTKILEEEYNYKNIEKYINNYYNNRKFNEE